MEMPFVFFVELAAARDGFETLIFFGKPCWTKIANLSNSMQSTAKCGSFPPYICSKLADTRNKSSKHVDSDFNPMDFTLELDADRSTSTKEHLEGYPEEESPKITLVCFLGKEGTSKAIDPDFPTSAATHLRTDASPAHCGPSGSQMIPFRPP
jgi:hypothetical protein